MVSIILHSFSTFVQYARFVSNLFLHVYIISANYQRRESVLEDLALFKSSSSILFFCHRDWIKATGMFSQAIT